MTACPLNVATRSSRSSPRYLLSVADALRNAFGQPDGSTAFGDERVVGSEAPRPQPEPVEAEEQTTPIATTVASREAWTGGHAQRSEPGPVCRLATAPARDTLCLLHALLWYLDRTAGADRIDRAHRARFLSAVEDRPI